MGTGAPRIDRFTVCQEAVSPEYVLLYKSVAYERQNLLLLVKTHIMSIREANKLHVMI